MMMMMMEVGLRIEGFGLSIEGFGLRVLDGEYKVIVNNVICIYIFHFFRGN